MAASKLSHAGKGLPSASVAERVRLSPTSTSLKLAGGTVKLKPASSLVVWSAMVTETTGASLTLATLTLKSWEAVAPEVSVAVTRMVRAPTSSFSGVPENVWVAASKLSHAGKGLPSASVADRVSWSPTSTSLKLAGGTVKLKPASSLVVWSAMVTETTGASLTLATLTLKSWEAVAPEVSVAVTRMVERPDIIVQRRAGEGLGGRIEAEPCGQGAAVGQCRRQGELVAHIDIAEAGGRHGEAEARVLIGGLVGNGDGNNRGVIDIGNTDAEVLGGGSP